MKKWFTAILSIGLILSLTIPVSATMAPGLVGYWRFEGNANDNSGNSNDGTLGAGAAEPTLVAGQSGQAYSFDGGDLITVLDDATINFGSGDFTIVLRSKATGIAATNYLVSKGAGGAPGKRYGTFWSGTGTLTIEIDDATTGKSVVSASTHDDDTWQRLTVQRNGTNLRLFINGTEDANSPTAIGAYGDIDDTGNDLVFGRFSAGATGFLTGSIDEILFYDRALAEHEIRQVSMGFLHGGM